LKIPKDKRKQYFKGMPAEDILEENRALNSLYQSAFEVMKIPFLLSHQLRFLTLVPAAI